ncbi:MAG: PfkB family carbohydrate kinase [Fibrobacterota bacterium]
MPKNVFVFGEVLYDSFVGGGKILGGAPFNVAWNLRGFGQNPFLISRVGQDSDGDAIIDAMNTWGLSTQFLQIDKNHTTGEVTIDMTGDEPDYDIHFPRAYDFIDCPELPRAASCGDILYYGSLAVRHEKSRAALLSLLEQDRFLHFCDINVRPPWFSQDIAHVLLLHTDILKVNEEELRILSTESGPIEKVARQLMSRFSISTIIYTAGASGARIITKENQWQASPGKVEGFQDPVGAGDSLAAVILNSLQKNDVPDRNVLQRGVNFAAQVCALEGATTKNREFYANQ